MTSAKKRVVLTAEERRRQNRLKAAAKNREDFMKRWFAIAISVGFATAVSNMPWLHDGRIFEQNLPVDWDQIKQLFRLAVAVIATVLSWEGYLLSISTKPLKDGARFFLDVSLVFIYLLLLLTSKFSYFWVWIHAGVFPAYCLWDYLSIRQYPKAYANRPPASNRYIPTISEVYQGSLGDNPKIYRGPAITLMWPIYFGAVALSYQFVLWPVDRDKLSTTVAYTVFVFYGLYEYRRDKRLCLPFWYRWTLILAAVFAVLCGDWILHNVG
jgi:hypothetical protein